VSGALKIVRTFSLTGLDKSWQSIIEQSRFLSMLKSIVGLFTRHWQQEQLGSLLQKLSFFVTVLLFASLTLPQFANDKEALAVIPLIGFFLWMLGALLGGKEKRNTNAIDSLIILWASVNLISACSSHFFLASLKGLAKVFVYLSTYFLLTSQLNHSKKRKLVLVLVLLAMGTVTALYGLYQYKIGVAPLATWEDPNIENKTTRIYATLNNPNLLAGYLVPLLPLSTSLMFACFWRKQWVLSILPAASSAILTLAIVLTGSRGGYLGLVASTLVIFAIAARMVWQRYSRLRVPLILACIVGAFLPLVAIHSLPALEQRLSSIFVGREHSSNSFRLNVWSSSLSMFKDNWWLGIGIGNQAFCLAYGLYMRSGFDALGTYCVPLEVAVETGIVGLIIFTLLVFSTLLRAHLSFWQGNVNDWYQWLMVGAAAGLIGLMFHGLVDTIFFRPQVQLIFWLIMALLATA
jgi:putative inorganic carbon (hco3(-)) transporter